MRSLALLFLCSAASLAAAGTLRVPGHPAAPEPKSRAAALTLQSPSLDLRLRPISDPDFLAPKAAFLHRAPGFAEKRLRVGARRDVPAESETVPEATALRFERSPTGGRVAQIRVTSPAAAALRLGLRVRGLPATAELRVASASNPDRVAGPISGEAVLSAMQALGTYWTPVTEGETQVVEVWIGESDPDGVRIEVESVSHLGVSPAHLFKATGLGASQPCHEDVMCVAAANPVLAKAARAVAKLLYTENGVSYVCTGTLVSDGAAASQVPYLYTAAHCIGSQAAAATLNTFWFFEAALCGGKSATNYRQLAGGAKLLYANTTTDAALVRLSERAPEGAWFAGWDASPLEGGAPLVALHHPAGDLKKLSLGQALGVTAAAGGASYATAAWTSGSTEGGSSGSGLFTLVDGEYLLRGGLRGGSASCASTGRVDDPANRDYYSRIDLEAATLRTWLTAAPAPLDDYTDLWSDPAEPGWGLAIVQNAANRVFATWFTHDAAGAPTWVVMPEGSWRTAVALEGALFRATGSAFDAPYDRARFSVSPVGTARIEFGYGGTATLTFTVDGKTVVKTAKRQPL